MGIRDKASTLARVTGQRGFHQSVPRPAA